MFFSTDQSPLGSMESSVILACSHITFAGDSQLCIELKEPGRCGRGRGRHLWRSLESPNLRSQSKRHNQATGENYVRDYLFKNTHLLPDHIRHPEEIIRSYHWPPRCRCLHKSLFPITKTKSDKILAIQRTPWDKPVLWTWWRTCECLVFQLARDSPH